VRFRKNIDCLFEEELQDFRDALAGILGLPNTDPNSFWQLACLHGGPPVAYCRHFPPGFFTWHRAYLMAYERALQKFNCEVSLPYWDWSSGPSTGLPKACSTATYTDRHGNTSRTLFVPVARATEVPPIGPRRSTPRRSIQWLLKSRPTWRQTYSDHFKMRSIASMNGFTEP